MVVRMLKIRGPNSRPPRAARSSVRPRTLTGIPSAPGRTENPASLQPWRTGFGHPPGRCRLSRLLLAPQLQVRIHKAVEVPPRPPVEDVDSDTAAEPAEQEELLDSGAAAERSDWL